MTESKTAFVKTEKAFVKTESLKVIQPKQPPKRTEIKNPITQDQKTILKNLIEEQVITGNLAKRPIGFGTAWNKLFDDGLKGEVNKLEQIEQGEFEQCRDYINQRIMIIEAGSKTKLTRYKDNWHSKHIGKIHALCKEQGVTDERRKAYMVARWGKDSLTLLTDDELRECYIYATGKSPSWTPRVYEIEGTPQQREKSLLLLLKELEATDSSFDRQKILFSKQDMLSKLIQRDRTLWTDREGEPIAETTFNRFLTNVKLCKFKPGIRKAAA